MKINNYVRYIIGASVTYSVIPVLQGNIMSIYNFCILFLLIFAIIKDLNNGSDI